MTGPFSLTARSDTFLGVCEALSEDLRVPATLLRIGFGVALALVPVAALAVYVGLAGFIALIRFVWPATVGEVGAEAVRPALPVGDNDDMPAPRSAAA